MFKTSAVPSYAAHPIKQFLQAGILDTLNTDDPGISAVTISQEELTIRLQFKPA